MPPHVPIPSVQLTIDNAVIEQQPKASASADKVSYAFVDMVRFLATLGIVYIHSYVPMHGMETNAFVHHMPHAEYYLYVKQLFKFATICYFLIAGFLLADKSIESSPFTYYRRRLNVIAIPYIFALLLFIAALALHSYITSGHHITIGYVIEIAKYVLLYSPFWYVPNYLLCLFVIVCFSKYATSIYFGAVLFLITALNTWFNVYAGNTHTHTTALTGFIFYMWLGMYIKKKNLVAGMQNAGPIITGAVMIVFYILSDCETHYMLFHTHIAETLNTLRISNQLYSVAFFAFIVSCCKKPVSFGGLNPRKETYGIYLYHSFFTFIIISLIEQWLSNQFGIDLFSFNVYHVIIVTLISFILSYIATTMVVKLLLKYKLAWLPQM
jgi:hypothetical protein